MFEQVPKPKIEFGRKGLEEQELKTLSAEEAHEEGGEVSEALDAAVAEYTRLQTNALMNEGRWTTEDRDLRKKLFKDLHEDLLALNRKIEEENLETFIHNRAAN